MLYSVCWPPEHKNIKAKKGIAQDANFSQVIAYSRLSQAVDAPLLCDIYTSNHLRFNPSSCLKVVIEDLQSTHNQLYIKRQDLAELTQALAFNMEAANRNCITVGPWAPRWTRAYIAKGQTL